MAGFGRHIAGESVHDPLLTFKHGSWKILQRDRHSHAMRADLPHMAVVGRRARNPSRMNQNTVATFEIGSVPGEFEREGFRISNDRHTADGTKIFYAKLQTAVIEKIRKILVRMPSFTLD